jgi:hypothetical protein
VFPLTSIVGGVSIQIGGLQESGFQMTINSDTLRSRIIQSLQDQGFVVEHKRILPPPQMNKAGMRDLHTAAVQRRIERSKGGLIRYEPKLLNHIAAGMQVDPEQIFPTLVEVLPDSEDELLFRYVSLHWSIPVSSGYGRRLRFLVIDQSNGKLIGIIGLGDPVISLAARDLWIGWDKQAKHERLRYVLDAFVLGAVPPYSLLLCGKLIALLAASSNVRESFFQKYQDRSSLIRSRTHDIQPVLITTMSALGKSSLYNRLAYSGGVRFQSVGYTSGYGEFHFSNGLYKEIAEYARACCIPTARNERWGKGFRNRREVIRKVLSHIGISDEWLRHGIKREIFVVPLASNVREFLRGQDSQPEWFNQSASDLFSWFRRRWLLPRASRDNSYYQFDPQSYRLWNTDESTPNQHNSNYAHSLPARGIFPTDQEIVRRHHVP